MSVPVVKILLRTVPYCIALHCIAQEHPIALREFEEAKRRRLIE
jgi:hypothetical protein